MHSQDDIRRHARWRLLLLVLAVAATFGAVFAFLPHDPAALAELAGLPVPVLAAGAFCAWALLTPALVSGTLLAAATGLLLGPAGMPVALGGALLGSGVAFLLARRLGRGPAEALCGPRLERLKAKVEKRPVLSIALIRIAPAAPATILNYAAGLTRIRLRDFLIGSALGGAPRILAYTVLGGVIADGALAPAIAIGGALALLGAGGAIVARRRRAAAPLPATA